MSHPSVGRAAVAIVADHRSQVDTRSTAVDAPDQMQALACLSDRRKECLYLAKLSVLTRFCLDKDQVDSPSQDAFMPKQPLSSHVQINAGSAASPLRGSHLVAC